MRPFDSSYQSSPSRGAIAELSIASMLTLALYAGYRFFSERIHQAVPTADPLRVTAWLRPWLEPHDGLELPVMSAAVLIVFGVRLSLALSGPSGRWFSWWPIHLLLITAALVMVGFTRTTNFTPHRNVGGTLSMLGVGAGVLAACWVSVFLARTRPRLARALGVMLLGALGVFVVGSARAPNPFDYGFFIAPALKLAQGETLGSFYMQYNLIGTVLIGAAMALDLRLHEMAAALDVLFVLWLCLYGVLARRLMESRLLVALFAAALVLCRFVAVDGAPSMFPQVTFLRMDLWVLLALALDRFGFLSPVTALAFALSYVADNVFGFVYVVLYALALLVQCGLALRERRRVTLQRFALVFVPLVLASVFQVVTFGGLSNPAVRVYQDVHIGFLPIEPRSMFWPVCFGLLAAMAPIARDPDPRRRAVTLFLFAFAVAQLTYFAGRSHDHNLINIAGIWVLIGFIALDRLRYGGISRRWAVGAAVVWVLLAAVATGQPADRKGSLLVSRLRRGLLIEPADVEADVAAVQKVIASYPDPADLFVFSRSDAYLNYRAKLRQRGYFAPFYASVFTEDTAAFLEGLVQEGVTILFLEADPEFLFTLNDTERMKRASRRFALVDRGDLTEVVIVPR